MEKGLKVLLLALLLVAGSSFADCYRADQDSGRLEFEGVADGSGFSGSFGEFEVQLCMDESLADAEIRVTVKTGSADTGNRLRDGELHGKNLFAVDTFPESTWVSTAIEADGDGFVAEGDLTLRDITKNQTVKLQLDGNVLTGSANILRLDWGVGQGADFEDPDFVRNRVDLSFELALEPAAE